MGKKQSLNNSIIIGDYEITPPSSENQDAITVGDYTIERPKAQSKGFNPDAFSVTPEMKLEDALNALPKEYGTGDFETKKQVFKELAQKGATKEQLSEAFITMSGKHPLQEGGNKYYYNEKGIPVPIKSNERPPQGFDVANDLHGTQKEANEVGFLNSAGRHLYNGLWKGVLGLEAMANLPYGLITGEDADWYKSAKNRVESSLYKTPEYEHEEQLWDPKETKDIGDVLLATINPSNYNINKNTVQGAALQGMESVVSFLVGTKGMGALTKVAAPLAEGAGLLKAGSVLDETGNIIQQGSKATDLLRATSSAGVKAQAFGGAYSQSYPEIEKYVEDAGVTGREKYGLSASIAIPFAFSEMMFGTEGLFVKNQAAKAAKQKVIQGIVDGAKRGEGPLTEEYLANVFKATTSEAAKLNKSFARELAGNIAEEAGTEAFQEFQKQGLTKMYDKLSGDENFKQDPFSFEAFKDYYNSALSGAFGAAGPSTMATFTSRNREVKEMASNNIFNVVQKGDDAVDVLKKNIGLAVKNGDITADQGLESIYRVDSYAQYNKLLKDNSGLSEEDKKKVFDLTFQKQNLEDKLPTEYEAEKLNGIEQAQIEAKRKQAKLLQDDINKIIFKEQVKSSAEKTSEAVKDEIRKDSDKQFAKNFKIKVTEGNDVLQDEEAAPDDTKYKVPEVITKETRSYNDIPINQWNDPKFNTRVKQFKLAEHLEAQEGDVVGVINEDANYEDNGHKVQTFNVTMPDGKSVRFASSMVRRPTKDEKGGFRGNTYEENFDNRDNPIGAKVGMKVVKLKDSGRKVIFIYNAEEGSKKGRHIGMVKESLRGNSNYSKADLEEMADLRMTNMAEGGTELIEDVSDEEKAKLSDDQKSFNDWEGEQKDIITGEEGDYPFEPKGEYENKQKYKTKEGEEIPYTSLAQESEQGSLDLFGEEDKNSNYDSGVKDEICWMERRMSKGQVSLTGNSTIKSSADVAYLFRHLESAVSENAFVVFTKNDGSYNVLYLATGSTIGVMVDAKMVYAAAKDFGATGVYFVHNHPTGNLKPSQPDYTMHGKLLRMFSNTDVKVHDSVIINLDSGQYTEFSQSTHQQLGTKGKPKKEIEVPVHSFDKQILYTPSFEKTSITSSADVASFLSKQKRGIIPKLGIIVLDRKNAINRYIMLDDSLSGKELLDKIIYNVGKSGESVIMVTNDKFNVTDINDIKKELAISEITLLDAIQVNPDPSIVSSYKSFVDEGMISEPKEEYVSEEGRKYSKEEKKEQRKQERSRLEELLGVDDLNDFKSIKDAVANMSMEDLILAYNEIVGFQTSTKNKAFNNVKREIAYRTFTKRKEEIKKEYPDKFIEEMANKTDLKPKDVLMKALSHMTESFPELQEFSKMFDSSFFDMTAERYTLKNQLEKLGKKVIEEKNKQLGIVGRLGALFSSDNAKYFDFVEKDGKYLTVAEAKAKGLSDNQVKFLEFMHKLNDLRNDQLEQMGGEEVDDVLKVDKGWKESFKTEGILQAFSAYLGNGFNLRNVRIKYTDPVTGKDTVAPYGEVEKKLYEYGEKGKMEKARALVLMLRYNFRAKKQVESGVNQDEKENKNVLKLIGRSSYQLNPFGALDNKFLKNRDKDRGYSKDFYKAAFDFVDDYTHTKHMSPLLPYIDSIEFLNEQGIIGDDGEILHAAKPQVVKWIKDWKDLHLFKTDKAGALGPEVDASLRALRKLTSLMVMAFNWVAGAWNISMGIYNNIRSETAEIQATGLKRLFAGKERGSLGLVNKKAQDILEKYHVVSIDYNSNPKLYAGRAFDQMAHGVTRAGEYVIQGSMFTGLMTEEDWNSFEYKTNKNGTEELVLKEGVDEKAFKERMIANKNKVSDIQGKYGEKDTRNYMISEFGKAVGQFKVWLPDAWKTRFGEEYIDRDGKVHKGTWRQFYGQGIKDLQAEIKEKGHLKAFWENKDAMSNIKGLAMVAIFLSLKLGGDDDEKKRRGGDIIDKALAQLFLGFDPQGTKFTFQNPVAASGPVLKLIDAVKHALELDGEKAGKDLLKIAPYNKIITQIPELIAGED